MKRPRLLFAIGLAVLCAAALWFWMSRDPGGEAKRAAADKEASAPPAPKRVASGARAERQSRPRTELLMDDDPEGSLRLEGQVIDAYEDPVAGALVSIDSNPPRTATTEADGSFYFDRLVGRTYRLVARAEGAAAGPVSARLTETNDPVILRLRSAARVEATVVEAGGGEPIPSATVELRAIDHQSRTTDGEGRALFEGVIAGGHSVVAYAPGFAKQHAFVRVASGATATVRLSLRPGAPVAGQVVTAGGEPVSGARVSYSGASEWSLQADQRLDSVETDADGRFEFRAMPAGSFRFIARQSGFAPGRSELVTLDGRTEETSVEIILEEGASLVGIVEDEDGQPVGTARVRVAQSQRRWGGTRQTFADDRGRFEIQGLPKRPVEVVALHESASSEIVEVDLSQPPSEHEITLVLSVTGTIAGVVVNRADEPIDGAQVFALPDFSRGTEAGQQIRQMFRLRGFPQELTDAGGRFEIRGLEPGSYQLRALPPGVSQGQQNVRRREGEPAETGDRDVRLVLVPDGSVKGKVAFDSGAAPEMFTVGLGRRDRTPFSTEDGSFELQDLPPRTYELVISGPTFDRKSVEGIEVEEGEVTEVGTITVTRGRKITGKVVDRGGSPVEGALVRSGKQVFGDGSSSKAAFGGPPLARSTKETRADERGEFAIYGVPAGDLAIVAEHEERGRSKALTLRGRGESIHGVTLALAEFGALEGTVTRGGEPMEQVIINAASVTSPSVSYGVATGADGKFRFDRLAPDEYKVSAMTGRSPMQGFGFHAERVVVGSGETAQVDLEIDGGEITLVVELAARGGGDIGFATVSGVEGELSAATGRELQAELGARADQYSHWSISIQGRPVEMEGLSPGRYTVCAVPYPAEVSGQDGVMDYMEREGDRLPVHCKPVTVAAQPEEQQVLLEVELPEFVPPPS